MILELDVGNSRIKWRLRPVCVSDSCVAPVERGVIEYGGDVVSVLCKLPLSGVKKIFLASVLGEEKKVRLVDQLTKRSGITPWLAAVSSHELGVTCGYSKVEQLGVDRWLAMIAAYHKHNSAVCVIDAGSALTVDWVDSAGVHQGGYIVPGFSMARNLLLKNTGKVRFSEETALPKEATWPVTTREAVEKGLLRQAEGFLRLIEKELLSISKHPIKIIVAGGDAALVSSLLVTDVQIYEDAVLDGLSLLAPD